MLINRIGYKITTFSSMRPFNCSLFYMNEEENLLFL